MTEDWECGWESHRRAQAVRCAAWSLSEKLEWLEEAQRLVDRFARAKAKSEGAPAFLRDAPDAKGKEGGL
ncbi:MAG: hypothetical protein Q8T11_11025 [Elusimicrobiota bacterium]|nr:hypothetical protein [Elusimicrobiota bacterium]